MAKLYPIGIQNFESLRDDNYFYTLIPQHYYKIFF